MQFLFRVRNITKNEWFYVWSETTPTVDPNYPLDEVDYNSIVILEREVITDPFVQVDLTLGIDLATTNTELPLNLNTIIKSGTGFIVNSTNITIENPGTYEVLSSVCGELTGFEVGNRRRALRVELNRNSESLIQATRAGGYARTVNTGRTCHAGGSYIINITEPNETIGIHTQDTSTQSKSSISFTVQGGYLKIKRTG